MSPGELLAVTVIGNDRPGIVAGVARSLYDLGCNLEDVSSTILRGHFSMMLIVRAPEGTDASTVEQGLDRVADQLDLVVAVRPVPEANVSITPPTHMVSVYGADQPGIVFRVAEVLARSDVNITDLASRVLGEDPAPVYALMLEVAMTEASAAEALMRLRDELGVDVSVHPIDTDVL